jgi:hypothetical protein
LLNIHTDLGAGRTATDGDPTPISKGLGQLVNMTKSAIFFSGNCGDTEKERMKNVIDIQNEAFCENWDCPRQLEGVQRNVLRISQQKYVVS